MTRTQKMALKTTCCSLLLLGSIIQGFQDVPVFHYKTKEVMVGQNASLPCIIQNIDKNNIFSVEWSKKDTKPSKLALFAPGRKHHYFVSNVSMKTLYNSTSKAMGTYLELSNITKGNAGTYICVITIYPNGSIRKETELKVKEKVECDMNSTIEVSPGENVTIHCEKFVDVEYTWTKDMKLVSDSASLQLLSVTGASAGLYTLTAHRGNSCLEATFTIKVLTQTTDSRTDVTTLSLPYHSSSGFSEAASHSPTTPFAMTDDAASPEPTSQSQSMNWQNTSVSTAPNNSLTYTQTETGEGFDYSQTQQTTSNYSPTQRLDTVTNFNHSQTTMPFERDTTTAHFRFNDTVAFSNKTQVPGDGFSEELTSTTPALSMSLGTAKVNAGASLTSSPRSTTGVTVEQDSPKPEGQSHLAMLLGIIGGVLLIIMALILYRRRVIKKRMDLPPPFKPPPPPVKYTAVRNPEQQFPTDRCNSIIVGASTEMRQTFV